MYGTLRDLEALDIPEDIGDQVPVAFKEALYDDLNTSKALAELFSLSKQANSSDDESERVKLKAALLQSGEWLGLLQQDPQVWFKGSSSDVDAAEIDQLIAERIAAREQKNWDRADEIRDILTEKKVLVEDGANGTRWRIET